MTTCNHCEKGFINLHQIDEAYVEAAENGEDFHGAIEKWIASNEEHDVAICGCCGDGVGWYGTPGEHYTDEDPTGPTGPYAYNGGLCECH